MEHGVKKLKRETFGPVSVAADRHTAPPIAQGAPPIAQEQGMEYKILTQKDRWFSGKFDPDKLEQALNAYAEEGWRVRGMATAQIPGWGSNREELIVVLERTR